MAGEVDAPFDGPRPAPGAAQAGGRAPMRGHALLAHVDGRIAIWQTAPEGVRSGAWVADDDPRPDHARALLTLVERRAVAGLDRDDDLRILAALGAAAGVPIPDCYGTTWVDLSEAHLEIVAVRAELSRALRERRPHASGEPGHAAGSARLTAGRAQPAGSAQRAFAPLSYTYPVASHPWPRALPAALDAAQLALPTSPAGPAERAALGKALLLQWATLRWEDTESARLRREPLRDLPSPHPRPLPPRWQESVRQAYGIVLHV